jgi:hypothetical protein
MRVWTGFMLLRIGGGGGHDWGRWCGRYRVVGDTIGVSGGHDRG